MLTISSTTLFTLVSCVKLHHMTWRAHGFNVPAGGKSSGQRKLDNDSNNFERKRTDRFEVEAALGPIARARIGHDNGGLPGTAAWCLAGVSVQPEGGTEVTFDVPGSAVWLEVGPYLSTFQVAVKHL